MILYKRNFDFQYREHRVLKIYEKRFFFNIYYQKTLLLLLFSVSHFV
jgi:hypothetical protein